MAKGPGGFSVGRVSIQVVPDTSNFRKELQAQLKKETKGLKVEIPVDVDAKKAITQLKVLDNVLKRIDGRQINIGANVSGNSQDMSRVADNLRDVARNASEASNGFASMSRTGFLVLGVVLLLAPALGAISVLIAGLPSLMFAFGGAAAAVALGFDGIKKAASGFAPTVERLKKSLSGTFEKNLTQPFKDLNKLAPVLDSGLNKIATSLSNIISNLIGLVTSTKGMEQINTILSGTAKFFDDLVPAINMGMQALLKLGEVGAQNFGLLNETFTNFSRNFLESVNRMAANGSLVAGFQGLNKVLSSLLEGFTKLFEAGVQAMGVLGGPLSFLIDNLINAFVSLMPFLTEITNLVSNVLGEAFKQLGPILDALRPGFTALARLLGQVLVGALQALGPILTTVATILSTVVLKVIEALTPHLPALIGFFTQLGTVISTFLLQAFTALAPLLGQFLQFISGVLTAIQPLIPVILQFIETGLKGLITVLQALAPGLSTFASEALPQIVAMIQDLVPLFIDLIKAIEPVIPIVAELAAKIIEYVIPVMKDLFSVVKEVWPEMRQIISGMLTHIQGLINIFLGIITMDWERVWEGIKQSLSGVWEGIKGAVKLGIDAVIEFFVNIPSRIAETLFGLPSQLAESGRAMMRSFGEGIKQAGRDAINAAKGMLSELRGLFPFSPAKYGPFSGSGYTDVSGRHLMQDWAKGINEGAPEAVRAVEDAMSATHGAMELQASVATDGYGSIGDKVAEALAQWGVQIDANGMAKMVNKVNNLNARRA